MQVSPLAPRNSYFAQYSTVVYCHGMPKVTRKRVSVFESSAFRWGGALVGVSGLIVLASIFFGMSDKGAIDVSGKINSTDQTGFASQVNPMNNGAASVNGGLRPAAGDVNAAPPAEPEPVVEPSPENAAASSTESEVSGEAPTTTPDTSEVNSGLTPNTE